VRITQPLAWSQGYRVLNSPGTSLSLNSAVLQSYFHHDGAGFMSIHLGKDVMNATFYDSNGTQLYTAQSTRKYAPSSSIRSLSLSLRRELAFVLTHDTHTHTHTHTHTGSAYCR
jgi:hypothetical protein